jgi:hypothetical protein
LVRRVHRLSAHFLMAQNGRMPQMHFAENASRPRPGPMLAARNCVNPGKLPGNPF